jgi:pimeloyl-ACP methyl ester carboxylesterase
MKISLTALLSASALLTDAFVPTIHSSQKSSLFSATIAPSSSVAAEKVNPDMTGIQELACLDTARRMVRTPVPVSTNIHPSGQVGISYAFWPSKTRSVLPPVVMIHGFDSSCLEYRRLGARLAERGIDTYAVDLLGWGFTQLDGTSFSAQAKIEALQSFLETVVGKDYILTGASLGGAAAIEVASISESCLGIVLIDAQGFVDGIGPMAAMPKAIAKLGVGVLKSIPLRSSANQMSYYDKVTYATDEAVTVGRVHCLQEGWSDALVSFMQSGGFSPSSKIPKIQAPALVLWGRQDGILDGAEFAPKFLESLPDARLQWIEECGHVPHLEQPDQTADAISAFVKDTIVPSSDTALVINNQKLYPFGLALFGVVAGSAAVNFLPLF